MRRCPSFSTRPGFPRGLQVLVLDPDLAAGVEAEVQLKDCGYQPVACCSSAEALLHLTNPDCSFDLLLVDVMCLSHKSPENSVLLAAAKTLPLVLMSSCCSPGDIMIGIKQGAVDFLEKPLHMHRLRNIWQHVVRKMMGGGAAAAASAIAQANGCDACAALVGSAGGTGSAANSAGCPAAGPEDSTGAGETGSNESTSDRANGKHAHETMELDLETSSLLDAVDTALGNPLAGLTSGFSHLLMNDHMCPAASAATASAAGPCIDCASAPAPNGAYSAAARQLPSGCRSSVDLLRHPHGSGRSERSERKRCSAPGNTFSSSGGDKKPVMGHPAGQLPFVGPGVEWGLPTNPLQIAPKVGLLGPKMPAMPPWMSPMMPPASLMMQMAASGLMMPGAMAMAAAAAGQAPLSAAAVPPQAKCVVAPAAPPAVVPAAVCKAAPVAGCEEAQGAAGPLSCDLLSALNSSKPLKAPIGLSLKKSMSLVDLINESLMKHASALSHVECNQA